MKKYSTTLFTIISGIGMILFSQGGAVGSGLDNLTLPLSNYQVLTPSSLDPIKSSFEIMDTSTFGGTINLLQKSGASMDRQWERRDL
jgi:hypothetical protein